MIAPSGKLFLSSTRLEHVNFIPHSRHSYRPHKSFCRCLSPRSPQHSSQDLSAHSLKALQSCPSHRNNNRAKCPPNKPPSQLAASGVLSTCTARPLATARVCWMRKSDTPADRPLIPHTVLYAPAPQAVSIFSLSRSSAPLRRSSTKFRGVARASAGNRFCTVY